MKDMLLREKMFRFIAAIKHSSKVYGIIEPKINIWDGSCPYEEPDELAHYHSNSHTICVSKKNIIKMNYDEIEKVAKHEFTHYLQKIHTGNTNHETDFQNMEQDVNTATWRPPGGIVHISGNNKVKEINQKKGKIEVDKVRCNYHLCGGKRKLFQCRYCDYYFCEEHIYPIEPHGFNNKPKLPRYTVYTHPCAPWASLSDKQKANEPPIYIDTDIKPEPIKEPTKKELDEINKCHEIRHIIIKTIKILTSVNVTIDYDNLPFYNTYQLKELEVIKKEIIKRLSQTYIDALKQNHKNIKLIFSKKQELIDIWKLNNVEFFTSLQLKEIDDLKPTIIEKITQKKKKNKEKDTTHHQTHENNKDDVTISSEPMTEPEEPKQPKKENNKELIKAILITVVAILILGGIMTYYILNPEPIYVCSDLTVEGSCSNTLPLYCSGGTLVKNTSFCGCPTGERAYQDDCIPIIECEDGTLDPECSDNQPYQCLNGALTFKASVCGCPEGYKIVGERCVVSK